MTPQPSLLQRRKKDETRQNKREAKVQFKPFKLG
jgi:hypothetical protein